MTTTTDSTSSNLKVVGERRMSNTFLESSFRKRTIENSGISLSGVLYKKKANASLYKITSVLKEGKSLPIWQERKFDLSDDGVLSYTSSGVTSKIRQIDLKECFLRLGTPFQDTAGLFHMHIHTVDGAPTPFTFEVAPRLGLEAGWALCARTDKELLAWIRGILSHMYPFNPETSLSDESLALPPPILALNREAPELGQKPRRARSVSALAVDLDGNVATKQVPRARSFLDDSTYAGTAFSSTPRDAISLLSSGDSKAVLIIPWLELFVGLCIMNILLSLLVVASPWTFESWFLLVLVNLFFGFAILVRVDDMVKWTRSQRLGSRVIDNARATKEQIQPSRKSSNTEPSFQERGGVGLLQADSSGEDEEDVYEITNVDSPSPKSPRSGDARTRLCGTSTLVRTTSDSGPTLDLPKHTYCEVDATRQFVRVGPNYRREGRKAPSEPSLMVPVACDLYHSEEKLNAMFSRIVFPEPTCEVGTSGLPQFFVFNIQVQDQGPSLFGSKSNSGYSLVGYFEPSVDFIRQSQANGSTQPSSNAARLSSSWLTNLESDLALKERLKLKATVMNDNAAEILGWMSKYNSKPTMVTKSNTMTRGTGRTVNGRSVDVVECDVDLRVWNLLFRQGLSSVLPTVGKLCFSIALVIEGESDDELPERILAAVQLNYIDLSKVSPWS